MHECLKAAYTSSETAEILLELEEVDRPMTAAIIGLAQRHTRRVRHAADSEHVITLRAVVKNRHRRAKVVPVSAARPLDRVYVEPAAGGGALARAWTLGVGYTGVAAVGAPRAYAASRHAIDVASAHDGAVCSAYALRAVAAVVASEVRLA